MNHYPPVPGMPSIPMQYHLQIPQMPILGPSNFEKLLQNIYKSIVDEASAADFYSRLLREAPDQLHREFINHAYQDELEHLEAFTRLYRFYTGQIPSYSIKPVQYRTFKEGLLIALGDELEAADFYKDNILASMDQLVRDTFFLAMVDELEHSTRFSFLYNLRG